MRYLFGYLPAQELTALQNSCGLHLCPSETEGFGYYIMEGLSCGAVVATTDAPPMNEFVSDKRCLVGVEKTAPMHLATNYYADPKKLDKTVSDLLSLSEEELKEIGSGTGNSIFRKRPEIQGEGGRNFLHRNGSSS